MPHLTALRANITTLAVDAFVNAANSSLLGGSQGASYCRVQRACC